MLSFADRAGWMGAVERVAGAEIGYEPGQLRPASLLRWPSGRLNDVAALAKPLVEAGESLASSIQAGNARTVAYAMTTRPADFGRVRALSIYADLVVIRDPVFMFNVYGPLNWDEGENHLRRALALTAEVFVELRPLIEADLVSFCSELQPGSEHLYPLYERALAVDYSDFDATDNPALYRDWLRVELWRGSSWAEALDGHVVDVTQRAVAARTLRSEDRSLSVHRLDALAQLPMPGLDQLSGQDLVSLRADSEALHAIRQALAQVLGGVPTDLDGAATAAFIADAAREQLPPLIERLRKDMSMLPGIPATGSLIGAVIAGTQLAATGHVAAAAAVGAALGPVPVAADMLAKSERRRRARLIHRVLLGFTDHPDGLSNASQEA
jgi:hypothetical protein